MHAISTAAFVSVLALVSSLVAATPAAGTKPQCIKKYTVPKAEPCDTLVANLGLSQADLLSLNSELSCDGTIPAGKVICIKQSKPKPARMLAPSPKKPAPTCKKYVTAAETTCDALAPKFGLTPKKFIAYNDNVNDDCTNLVPGQMYCVDLD